MPVIDAELNSTTAWANDATIAPLLNCDFDSDSTGIVTLLWPVERLVVALIMEKIWGPDVALLNAFAHTLRVRRHVTPAGHTVEKDGRIYHRYKCYRYGYSDYGCSEKILYTPRLVLGHLPSFAFKRSLAENAPLEFIELLAEGARYCLDDAFCSLMQDVPELLAAQGGGVPLGQGDRVFDNILCSSARNLKLLLSNKVVVDQVLNDLCFGHHGMWRVTALLASHGYFDILNMYKARCGASIAISSDVVSLGTFMKHWKECTPQKEWPFTAWHVCRGGKLDCVRQAHYHGVRMDTSQDEMMT